jgi:hypothetical protein
MSNEDQIERLLSEVQSLRDNVTARDRDEEMATMERELNKANSDCARATKERDDAVAELAKVKHDIQWTMGHLLIRDIIMHGKDIPLAGEGWLPLNYDPEDTTRIEWINAHGRAGCGANDWLIAIPHRLVGDETIPQPYNFRHLLDLSRKSAPNGDIDQLRPQPLMRE